MYLDIMIQSYHILIGYVSFFCFHNFGSYIYNGTMNALGHLQDMFSNTAIQLQPIFAQ